MSAGDIGRRLRSMEDILRRRGAASFFAFDGTNSDLARQLYFRAKANQSAAQFTNLVLPPALQDRLDNLQLQWDRLPGIAQRALLWDSGFVVTPLNAVVQIWPLGGYSMTELAVPLAQFQAIGCVEMNCTQPDNSSAYSNDQCTGDAMLEAARCVVEDFEDRSDPHLAMWMTGGNPEVIPTPSVTKHIWKDKSNNVSYSVPAIHTLELDIEPAYGECAKDQNGGYGSLVLPCHSAAEPNLSEKQDVQGSAWVSRWLVEDYSKTASATSAGGEHKFNTVLLMPIILVPVVAAALIVLFVYRKRKQHEDDHAAGVEDLMAYHDTLNTPAFKGTYLSDGSTTHDRSTLPSTDDTMTTSRPGLDQTIRFRSSNDSTMASSAESNHTLRILLYSDFLVEKRIPYESITFEQALRKGANGEVWRCEYMGQQVAVKRLLTTKNHRAEEVEHFAKEIELNASLEHPHIASFVGVAWNSLDNLAMVSEFFPVGDLQMYLYKNADLLSWAKDKIHIAVGIGLALEYLHSRTPPLIHRDLKSKNVLLTRQLEAKLIDFGVSRDCENASMTAGVGTPYWTAPEILEGKRYTEQADIYSFGVLLSELDTCEVPYHDAVSADGTKLKPLQLLAEVMQGTLRPSFSSDCPQRIRRLGVTCCQHDPERRPTASHVVAMLKT
ncbi:hypothetical protein PHYBOEH_007406 [Phytophthora boehmeriae]|uniref:Protein kinase domain-containing protein n=1 Tax=Phytophthora boehmeriae TaxID=109152 RepID=A0A8T1WA25_9STRA|nr:hypothetical protein PHYBOEH_007406 [Phytophthora boehmeriae]